MANNIDYAKKYLPLLDELYKQESLTADLLGDDAVVREGANVGEVSIAKLEMDGLGDFDRASGYTTGNTTLTWETVKYDKERSQTLKIDRLDNTESMDMAFGRLAKEFIRTKVVPESDAARIAKIASTDGISTKEDNITDGATALKALRAGILDQDNNEVDYENKILYIRPEIKAFIDDIDSYKSKAVMDRFAKVVVVPPTRMYSAIELKNGKDGFGFVKAAGAKDINFLIVDKNAVIADTKEFLKYFSPDQDQDGDSHIFKYRNYNLYGYVYENKTAGVYASFAPAN